HHPAGGRLDGGAGQGKGGQQAAEKFSFHGENSSFLVCRCCTRAYRRE
ncbi:Maff2 family protein, partial [Dysosmobacter welbionis]